MPGLARIGSVGTGLTDAPESKNSLKVPAIAGRIPAAGGEPLKWNDPFELYWRMTIL
jgi:hypothetical protein